MQHTKTYLSLRVQTVTLQNNVHSTIKSESQILPAGRNGQLVKETNDNSSTQIPVFRILSSYAILWLNLGKIILALISLLHETFSTNSSAASQKPRGSLRTDRAPGKLTGCERGVDINSSSLLFSTFVFLLYFTKKN